MSDINLYILSNKIRTILLTTIDKEIFISTKKNHLLINSQSQEQLMKKFVKYIDFTIENEESFEGVLNNEDNNMFYDSRYSNSNNQSSFFCSSSNTSKKCLSFQHITKSQSPKKNNNTNTRLKKNKNLEISENNLCKLKIDSGRKLISKNSSFSCNKIVDNENSVSLGKDNNKKHLKKFSADLFINSINNKNDDSLQLINYCYKLKKPNDEIINEISDDDTSTNKKNTKNLLFFHRIKNNHHNISKKKLKKTINKKKINYKNNRNNDEHPLIIPIKKNSTNFTNEMKLYFDNIEKSNPKEKIKIKSIGKNKSNIGLKKTDSSHEKNILQLHHKNCESSEKKIKGKKFEQQIKSFHILEINKKQINKKLRHFKSIDNPALIKHKDKRGKREKNNASTSVNTVHDEHFQRKHTKSSKVICKKTDEFQQNEILFFEKKIQKNHLNKKNVSSKNEKKSINVSKTNYNYKLSM